MSMKNFCLLINVKMLTVVDFNIYEQEKFHAPLREHEIIFITSGPGLT